MGVSHPASAPRASVTGPRPLLHLLRLRQREGGDAGPLVAASERRREADARPAAAPARCRAAARPAAEAAAPPAAVGAQSSSGVPAQRLLGYRAVDLSRKREEIGRVEEVLGLAERGNPQPLLVVRRVGAADETEGTPREEHLIPYVPQIVPWLDLAAGVVYIQPPAGLLALGRQQQLLAQLERQLEPFTHPKPFTVLQRMGVRVMPTAAQLEAAGRRDLAAAVRRAGGFLEVAQALGLRSQRKPAGYWEDETNLDEELTLFVAAHWSKFADPESRQSYWYNQITHRISWEEPVLPQRVAIDDEGGYILTEAEEDRVMPSRPSVLAAGRYDLHHAVMAHGGYGAAGAALDRRPAWPPSQHLNSLSALRTELRAFLAETRLPRGQLPTASQLLESGRGDLYQAIVRRGGFVAVAEQLGWGTRRRARASWADAAAVAAELRRFVLATQSGEQQQQQQGSGERDGVPALPPGARMPTHRELAAAGRHDLKYALQQHGSAAIARLLGLPSARRGAHNRRGRAAGSEGHEAVAVAELPDP